jgi:hypothetical protein
MRRREGRLAPLMSPGRPILSPLDLLAACAARYWRKKDAPIKALRKIDVQKFQVGSLRALARHALLRSER